MKSSGKSIATANNAQCKSVSTGSVHRSAVTFPRKMHPWLTGRSDKVLSSLLFPEGLSDLRRSLFSFDRDQYWSWLQTYRDRILLPRKQKRPPVSLRSPEIMHASDSISSLSLLFDPSSPAMIRLDSSVFVNLKLLEQRPEPPAVSSTDVPIFCSNIDLSELEKMDQMTQRVRSRSSNKSLSPFT